MQFIPLLGRILFSLIFILASFGHFSQRTIQFAASQGVPIPTILVPLSGIMILAGGLAILLGYKARWGALLIVLFLVPVTLTIHRFWGMADPELSEMEMIIFLKNLGLLGGALFVIYFGSGPYSLSRSTSSS